MKRSLAAALVPFTVLAAAALAPAQESTFRIGTWNLEFLGGPANLRPETPARDDADYAAIGKKVKELGVAVLAVQEINDEASLRKVAAGAGPSWDVLLGTSGGWTDGKTAQRIGFLFDRAAVDLLHASELLELPREYESLPIFHRVPVTASFKHKASGCDFRLVTVHLKAGQKRDDETKRRGEAQALAKWIDTLGAAPGEDPDVIVLGDFNSTYGSDPEEQFESSGRLRYVKQRAPMPTIMHFADPIDHVVAAAACTELRADSLAIDGDFDGMAKEQWRKVYSDHFPVTAAFVANGDDDPDATFSRGAPAHTLPASQRAAAPVAADARTGTGWPPPVGTNVRVQTTEFSIGGRLAQPLPDGPGGWIVLEQDDGSLRGFAYAHVVSVTLLKAQ